MAQLPPALAAALRGDRPLLAGLVEIDLPGYSLRLLDGSGEIMVGGSKFVGRDPVYGVLDTIKGLQDTTGDQAPAITLGLIPASDAALAALIDPGVQGSPVTISMGCVDIQSGLIVSDPYVLAVGEVDVPTVKWGPNDRRLEYTITSIAERLFMVDEGTRLSDAFHQHIWPGELGCAFITGVETYVPWGQKIDLTAVNTRTNLPGMGQITTARTG